MIHAYSESYLYDAKQNLAECFDYAISNCRFNADIFSKLFVQSGYADKFERGNPAIVSGISGIELAQEIIMYAYMNYKFPEKIFSEERSEVYWAGWALADYQWATCRRFKDIFSRIPLSEIVTMYSVYHEMDIMKFVEAINEKWDQYYNDNQDGYDDILESLKVEIEKKEIKVTCDLTPQTYLANHQHVQQLMNNLINNAVKYNKQKGSLNIHSYLVDQDYIIEVSDTGRGISLIDQGRVFERFFRCDAGRDKETGGTGLGLAIVKHIVQYYKGTIHLESELGKGTTFKIVLPINKDSL